MVEDGDIVNIDITAFLDGVHGDTNATFLAGDVDEETRLLVERTKEALDRGDQGGQARAAGSTSSAGSSSPTPGASATAWSATSPATASAPPSTAAWSSPTTTTPRFDDVIEVGMTFTIEPMLNLGTHEWDMWDDDWTVVTKDRRRSAQFEHTLLVTADGAEVLTHP